jgi:hypothetical protein
VLPAKRLRKVSLLGDPSKCQCALKAGGPRWSIRRCSRGSASGVSPQTTGLRTAESQPVASTAWEPVILLATTKRLLPFAVVHPSSLVSLSQSPTSTPASPFHRSLHTTGPPPRISPTLQQFPHHLRSSEYENRPLSTFPSGILHFPLAAAPGLT